MSKNRKVAIIGGSLIGPAMAQFLDHAGVSNVKVFEALRRPHSQSGGVMGIRHETLSTLTELGVRPERVAALTTSDVTSYDVTAPGRFALRGVSRFPGVTTSWDAMYAALAGRADVHYGHRLTGIEPAGARYGLAFANGVTDDADCVIFADGRKSLGRDLLDVRPLRYNGYTVWRGLGETPRGIRPRGFQRYYDGSKGRLFSVTEPIVQSGRSYWELSANLSANEYATVARGRGPTDNAYLLPTATTGNVELARVIARAADRLPMGFQDMIAGSEVSGIPVNDVEMPSSAVFATPGGAVATLLGDALIPVRLQVGAGLNQGIAQAKDLAEVVASSLDSVATLKRWETAILERLAPIVELGRSRAHRINLGLYEPVRPGRTAVPEDGGPFGVPVWVTA